MQICALKALCVAEDYVELHRAEHDIDQLYGPSWVFLPQQTAHKKGGLLDG
jgi:hypothetical protein